jgi:hypothetical protein
MSELYIYEEDDPVLEIEVKTEINLNKKEEDTSGVEPHTTLTVTEPEKKVLECLPQPQPQKSNVQSVHQKVTPDM